MGSNSLLLRDLFLDRVLGLAPATLLDIGAGKGELVSTCRAAGVDARGIEPSDAVLEADSEYVVRGDAGDLPHADGSVEWVTFRHVPHHLTDPTGAFAEAWRIASVGLILGDPTYPDSDRGRAGRRADRWLKRMDRLRGVFHADVLSAEAMLAHLPEEPARYETEFLGKPGLWTPESLEQERADCSRGLEVPAGEEAQWRDLMTAAAAGEVSENGTQLVIAWKARG